MSPDDVVIGQKVNYRRNRYAEVWTVVGRADAGVYLAQPHCGLVSGTACFVRAEFIPARYELPGVEPIGSKGDSNR